MNRRIMAEPPRGSVVLAHGEEGTAWQRFYSDGLWHSVNGNVLDWSELQTTTLKLSAGGAYFPDLWVVHRTEEVA
jgi:hypothetical protein